MQRFSSGKSKEQQERRKHRLVIRAFDVQKLEWSERFCFSDHILQLNKNYTVELPLVARMDIQILPPGELDCYVDNILDVVPISTKVLGMIGEGITHTLTGCYALVTGKLEDGAAIASFGSSAGKLKDKICLGRCGTPNQNDWILLIAVTIKSGTYDREHVHAAYQAADLFIQPIRELLRQLDGTKADEKHEYYDIERPGKPKVVVIQEVSGQGAMYEHSVFAPEPSGYGGLSLIDMHNMPLLLTPNEYRDGALRALM